MTLPHRLAWVLTTAFTVAVVPVRADNTLRNVPTNAVVTNDPAIQQSLNRLYQRSALWRAAVAEVERLGRKAVVVTPRNVRIKDPSNGKVQAFDEDVIAEVQPIAEHETRVDAVVVVINVALLQRWQRAFSTRSDFEDDLDRVIAHEVYGHALPYLLAGDLAGKCADPVAGQRAEDACAIQRENAVRGELGLGQRREYGLYGLTVARPYRN